MTLHRLPVWRGADTPIAREVFFGNGRLLDPVKREIYNSFLRRKVFAMLQAMSVLAMNDNLDYGVLLDADTAINISNLELFTQAIPGGGDAIVYTGRCQQEALPLPGAPGIKYGNGDLLPLGPFLLPL